MRKTTWCILIAAALVAMVLPCGSVFGEINILETFDGGGTNSDTDGNVDPGLFDLPDWNAPAGAIHHGGDGTFDLVDSYDLTEHELGALAASIPGVGDIYQAIGQINRNLGPAGDATAHVRYENFEQGTLLQVQNIDTFLNFGNELGNNDTLFELIGTTYESYTGNLNSIVFIDAATTLASVTSVSIIPGGGNFDSLDVFYDISADTVNGGTNVIIDVSVDDGALQNVLSLDGTIVNTDFTQAMNVNAALGYVGQETLAVGAADPMRTGPTLDFVHLDVTIVPEPSTCLLLGLAVIGLVTVRRVRG